MATPPHIASAQGSGGPPPALGNGDPLGPEARILDGRCIVDRKLGEWGLGDVWLVWDVQEERNALLKVTDRYVLPAAPAVRNRLAHDRQSILKLSHQNFARAYDIGITEQVTYFLLEPVDGWSLIRSESPQTADNVNQTLRHLCHALQAAHDLGLVHGNLIPSNLQLVENWPYESYSPKVSDLGIVVLCRDTPELPEVDLRVCLLRVAGLPQPGADRGAAVRPSCRHLLGRRHAL